MDSLIYRSGQVIVENVPLARYLPRLPHGAVSSWLKEHIPAGSWVFDPFGASPELALEVAQAGYHFLVAVNNPINRFLLEMAATPPTPLDMRAALAEIASAKHGDERLEPHILGLYETSCDKCGQPISAEAFYWDEGTNLPFAKSYSCPQCGSSGEFPVKDEDLNKLAKFTAPGPHRARALERVARSDDPNREHVEEALNVYTPRAVYGLFTIINKIDSLMVDKERKRQVTALVLSALDQTNAMWGVPSVRIRPKVLHVPPRYRELNIWHALENAVNVWSSRTTAVPLSVWPWTLSSDGGICVYEGRIKDLAHELDKRDIKAVVSALPRPNQAFWTLCALWTGWLWGQDSMGAFAQVLGRRRYDWAWHTRALTSALRQLQPRLKSDTPFLGLVTENEAGFDQAVMLAAELSGFHLMGAAIRRRVGQSQFLWMAGKHAPSSPGKKLETIIKQAGQKYLAERGESTHYLHLQAAVLMALLQQGHLSAAESKPAEVFTQTRTLLETSLSQANGFMRYQGSVHSMDVGRWWLVDEKNVQKPLADRIEVVVVKHLLNNPGITYDEIDRSLCEVFAGLMTPEEECLDQILQSYGEIDQNDKWEIKRRDTPKARHKDLEEMRTILAQVGKRLGLKVKEGDPISWLQAGDVKYTFYLTASAAIGSIIFDQHDMEGEKMIVLPGGRAELVMYKLKRDHRLAEAVDQGWRFIKFRQARRFLEHITITLTAFDSLIDVDPLQEHDPQMPLL